MPVPKKLLALIAPVALLALSACTTGFPTQVARFQAMPAPEGQSFVIQAADPRDRGGLEFSQYADLVRRHMVAQGYREAASPQSATLVVSLGYGVDNGQTRIVSYPSAGFGPHYGYWPYYSRFGGYGPYYHGWHDPFWGYPDIRSYTVYTSYLDLDIRRAADGQSVFEGRAKARSQSDELPRLVPNLVEAIFTGFPGHSGEVVKITVPPPPRAG
ncbi:DUF4136 domain-containing protein [Sphingomonas sp.]|uniref:DUF4136 domain-containing protein n=1 Tax=Sphingomonas sp. TaxID=28214 RepID=UPI002FCBF503